MKSLDLLFYLNAKHRDRELGIIMILLVGVLFSLGVLSLLRGLGHDLIDPLTTLYPFDASSSVRSFLNKSSGPAVFFSIPFAIIFSLLFFRKNRSNKIIEDYNSVILRNSTLVTSLYSSSLIVSLFLAAVPFRFTHPLVCLPAQMIVLATFNFAVADRVISRISARG